MPSAEDRLTLGLDSFLRIVHFHEQYLILLLSVHEIPVVAAVLKGVVAFSWKGPTHDVHFDELLFRNGASIHEREGGTLDRAADWSPDAA